jgi:hypothetical protein
MSRNNVSNGKEATMPPEHVPQAQQTHGTRVTAEGDASPKIAAHPLTFAYALPGMAIAAIWLSVVLAAIFSPDMVTGSRHDHMASA